MKIYAHRGFSGRYPEGSKTAYVKAAEIGVDGVECDVRLTKDGVAVCFHDATTERITGEPGRVSQLNLAQLQERYELMTLAELLDLVIEKRIDLLIETKHPVLAGRRIEREVLRLLHEREVQIQTAGIRVIVFTFSYWAARYLAHRYPHAGFIVKRAWKVRFNPTKIVALGYWLVRENQGLVGTLKNREFFMWTLNSPEDIELARKSGASAAITNFPDMAKEVLAK
jgi:glycerophosphoryl diester phosphodiesterase